MQKEGFRSKRQYFLFQAFGTSLSPFNTHKSITKAKMIFFTYFPQINHTIRSILTSTLSESFRSLPMETACRCLSIPVPRTWEGAKFPKRVHISWEFSKEICPEEDKFGWEKVIITGTPDNFTLQGWRLTKERVTYYFLKTLTFSVSRHSFFQT